jgi:hypothetical protein
VLIAAHDIRYRDVFDGCIADCPLPDPAMVFDRAVEFQLGDVIVVKEEPVPPESTGAKTP